MKDVIFWVGMAMLVGALVLCVVSVFYRKILVKDMKKLDEKYYNKKSFEIDSYKLTYIMLKPECYEQVKQTEHSSIGFDIDTANIIFAGAILENKKENVLSCISLECWELRHKLKQEDLDFLKEIKTYNLSQENMDNLKANNERQIEKNYLLKEYN